LKPLKINYRCVHRVADYNSIMAELKRNPLMSYLSVDELLAELASRYRGILLISVSEHSFTHDVECECHHLASSDDIHMMKEHLNGEAVPEG